MWGPAKNRNKWEQTNLSVILLPHKQKILRSQITLSHHHITQSWFFYLETTVFFLLFNYTSGDHDIRRQRFQASHSSPIMCGSFCWRRNGIPWRWWKAPRASLSRRPDVTISNWGDQINEALIGFFSLSNIRRWDRIIQEHINVIKSSQMWQLYCIRSPPAEPRLRPFRCQPLSRAPSLERC